MRHSLNDRISLWLQHVSSATEGPTAKRKRQPSQYPSPPVSANMSSGSTPRDRGDDPERPVFETPKKRKTTHDLANHDTPRAASHSSASLLSRSDSSLPLGASHSQSGRLSPTKQLSRLTLDPAGLQLCTMDLDDPRLPPAAVVLIDRLQEVWESVAVVEGGLKKTIDELKAVSRHYNKFQTRVYADDDPAEADVGERSVSGLIQTKEEKSLALLRSVVHIVDKAQECHRTDQDESGWNHLVHTPLIDATFRRWSTGPSSWTPCMNANILPTYRIPSSPSSRVDYIFTLNPIHQERFLPSQPRTAAIQALQSVMPELSINQTDYHPIRDQPISLSIETKRHGGQERKAEMQLGIWLAAQWNLYSKRVSSREGLQALQFLPGVVVQGHEWKLVLATYDESGKTRLWTYQQFGTTDTILGAFQVVAGLKELLRWSEGTFTQWYNEHVLQIGGQGP